MLFRKAYEYALSNHNIDFLLFLNTSSQHIAFFLKVLNLTATSLLNIVVVPAVADRTDRTYNGDKSLTLERPRNGR